MRRHAQVEKQFSALGSPADTPRLSATNAAEIGNALVPTICSFLLPTFDPFQYDAKHVVQTADGVALRASNGERGMHVHSRDRNAHPKRAVMFEDDLHVGGFAQDANVREHSVVDQVMRPHAISAVLAPAEFFPLRLLNFP